MTVQQQAASVASRVPWLPSGPLRIETVIRLIAMVSLAIFAATTPGFLTSVSIRSFLTTMSFVGCVAVGMTFVTIGGAIMSFSLGVGLSATTIVFASTIGLGLWPAAVLSVAFGCALNGAQGILIGYFRANPIIITMAAFALITGCATWLTGGRGLYILSPETAIFKRDVLGIPAPIVALIGCVVIGQVVLAFTRIGRSIEMTGSNARAVLAAGYEPWRATVWSFVLAGLFTSVAAILMASRYGSGDLQHGVGLEYGAISAVLVGGTAIHGGSGSVVRTLFGTLVIAIFQAVLVLRGFSTEFQQLSLGLLVLLVIVLQRR